MKKLKMTMTALALTLGAGFAFASQAGSSDAAPACDSNTQCTINPNAVCCIDYSDPQNPVEVKGDKVQ